VRRSVSLVVGANVATGRLRHSYFPIEDWWLGPWNSKAASHRSVGLVGTTRASSIPFPAALAPAATVCPTLRSRHPPLPRDLGTIVGRHAR